MSQGVVAPGGLRQNERQGCQAPPGSSIIRSWTGTIKIPSFGNTVIPRIFGNHQRIEGSFRVRIPFLSISHRVIPIWIVAILGQGRLHDPPAHAGCQNCSNAVRHAAFPRPSQACSLAQRRRPARLSQIRRRWQKHPPDGSRKPDRHPGTPPPGIRGARRPARIMTRTQ